MNNHPAKPKPHEFSTYNVYGNGQVLLEKASYQGLRLYFQQMMAERGIPYTKALCDWASYSANQGMNALKQAIRPPSFNRPKNARADEYDQEAKEALASFGHSIFIEEIEHKEAYEEAIRVFETMADSLSYPQDVI